jgi:Fuc2NAc and GlcNAc transferase
MAIFGAALTLTGLVRRYAVNRRRLLDMPNARSSHRVATPRGGGLSIAVAFIGGTLALWPLLQLSLAEVSAIAVGGGAVAMIGLVDDLRSLPARLRFGAHVAAAAFALAALGGMPVLQLGPFIIELGFAGYVLGVVGIVWLLNLYNFMDGIDGIAATEAITVAAGAGLMLWTAGDVGGALWCLALVMAAAGFAYWNWPPARIFMGDVGSGFLGYVLGVLAVATSHAGTINMWSWLILLAAFVTDATVTLVRRMVRGERWYQAHRSHAYQRAARRLGTHRAVTVAVGLTNIIWLFPLAWFANRFPEHAWLLTLIAYLPLIVIVLMAGAGNPDEPVQNAI